MPKIWVPTNVLDINLRPGGDNSDLNSWNKVTLLCHCAFVRSFVRSSSHSIVAGDKHSFVRATVFLLSLELLSIPPKSSDGRTEVRTADADAITPEFALREKSGGRFPQC